MFGARVLDSRPETAGIQPFRQTLDISPSLNSEASPPLILSGDDFLRPSEFEAGFQPKPRTHSGARRNYNSSPPVQNLARSVNSGPSLDLSDSDAKFSSGPDPALIDLTSRPPVTVKLSTINWRARAHFERDRHTHTLQVLPFPCSSVSHCDAKNKESAAPAPFSVNEEFTVFTFFDSDGGTTVAPA
jgi:hypothetical protein